MAVKPIEVEDYYDKVHQATWARRTAGLFAAGTLGAVYGVAVGIVAAFLPAIFGAMGIAGATAVGLPAPGIVVASAGLFAGVTAVIGIAIGADVGANSASISTGLAEKEKREKLEKSQEVAVVKNHSGELENKTSDEEPAKIGSKKSGVYLWKAAPFLIPLFAVFGALIASNPLTASAIASLSFTGGAFAAQSPAAIAASASVFGMFGALMAFKSSSLRISSVIFTWVYLPVRYLMK